MHAAFDGYTRLDRWTAAALLVVVLLVSIAGLDRGHGWGDDFAAYMTQGIAISEGRFDEQIALNGFMHPSSRNFGDNEQEDTLVYVWGFPLLLSLVHDLVGYDQPLGTQIIYYKLPGVLCFAVFSAVLFLFYRRRFSYKVSVFLAGLLSLNAMMITETNQIMSDIPCLMAGMLALLLVEMLSGETRSGRRIAYGVLLGLSMWFCYVVRLNGVTMVAIAALGHVLELLRRRAKISTLWQDALPYLLFAALLGLSGLFFPAATSNTDHIASGPNHWILHNIVYYDGLIREWVCSMLPEAMPLKGYVHYLLYALIVVGILSQGIRSNLHLTALLGGTYAVLYLLPYVQMLRYLFNILPVMLMFAAYGAAAIGRYLSGMFRSTRLLSGIGTALMVMVFASNIYTTAQETAEQIRDGGWAYHDGAYSTQAQEIYTYVAENTPQDAVIAFMKPRALYLNTGRVSFVPEINGNLYKDADYLLLFHGEDAIRAGIWPQLWEEMTLEYENNMAQLYSLSPEYRNEP